MIILSKVIRIYNKYTNYPINRFEVSRNLLIILITKHHNCKLLNSGILYSDRVFIKFFHKSRFFVDGKPELKRKEKGTFAFWI